MSKNSETSHGKRSHFSKYACKKSCKNSISRYQKKLGVAGEKPCPFLPQGKKPIKLFRGGWLPPTSRMLAPPCPIEMHRVETAAPPGEGRRRPPAGVVGIKKRALCRDAPGRDRVAPGGRRDQKMWASRRVYKYLLIKRLGTRHSARGTCACAMLAKSAPCWPPCRLRLSPSRYFS